MTKYYRRVFVNCKNCGRIDEKNINFIDIEEDFQGRDLLTFECNKCGEVQKSLRWT